MIEAERAIDAGFREGGLTPEGLRNLLVAAEDARAALRFTHLSRHLSTRPVLTDGQIARYRVLRGYAADACAAVPDGHDGALWRRHNRCE